MKPVSFLFFPIILFTLLPNISIAENVNDKPIIILSDKQQQFLTNLSVIKKCVDPAWMPVEAINEQGEHIGIVADITDLMAKKLNIPIELVHTTSWLESIEKLKQGYCDIVTTDTAHVEQRDYLQTNPFLDLRLVYITQIHAPERLDFSMIKHKTIGIPAGYPIIELIKQRYGDVNIVEVESVAAGLLKVSKGELYAFSDILPVCSFSIKQQGLTNLKVAGHLDITVPMVMNVRTDLPELVPILSNVLNEIEQAYLDKLLVKWINVEYDLKLNWTRIFLYSLLFLLVLLFVLYWTRKVHVLNSKLKKANDKLILVSETDSLTNLKNRHYVKKILPEIINDAIHKKYSVGLAIFDIDYFKHINDKYGHSVGDECLVLFAQKMRLIFNAKEDISIRYGGEEFLLVSINKSSQDFIKLLEEFKHAIENMALQHEKEIKFTVSIGYTFHQSLTEWDSKLLIEPDKNLYHSKKTGRNKITGSLL